MAETGEIDLLFLDASRALTCPGCGQVGPRPATSDNAEAGRRRSTGFYFFVDGHGSRRVACCRCQQIHPGHGAASGHAGMPCGPAPP